MLGDRPERWAAAEKPGEGVVGYVCVGRPAAAREGARAAGAGAVIAVTDHANLTWRSPLTGPNDDSVGPRFPSMTGVYAPETRGRTSGRARSRDLRERTRQGHPQRGYDSSPWDSRRGVRRRPLERPRDRDGRPRGVLGGECRVGACGHRGGPPGSAGGRGRVDCDTEGREIPVVDHDVKDKSLAGAGALADRVGREGDAGARSHPRALREREAARRRADRRLPARDQRDRQPHADAGRGGRRTGSLRLQPALHPGRCGGRPRRGVSGSRPTPSRARTATPTTGTSRASSISILRSPWTTAPTSSACSTPNAPTRRPG